MPSGSPPQVWIREPEFWLSILLPSSLTILFRACAKVAITRHEEVEDELKVETPVTGVVVDEDGGDTEIFCRRSRVGRSGIMDWKGKWIMVGVRGMVSGERTREGPDVGMVVVDVGGDEDLAEAIAERVI